MNTSVFNFYIVSLLVLAIIQVSMSSVSQNNLISPQHTLAIVKTNAQNVLLKKNNNTQMQLKQMKVKIMKCY